MELIDKARWLSGKEAVDPGLVDELIPVNGKKPAVTAHAAAVMTAPGLPLPEIEKEPAAKPAGKIGDRLKKIFSPNNNVMDRQYSFLNSALGVEGLEATDRKESLSAEQIPALNNRLKTDSEALDTATAAKETAEAAGKTAEEALNDVLNRLDATDPTVKAAADAAAKVTAIPAKPAERPGRKPEAPQGPPVTATPRKTAPTGILLTNYPTTG